MARRKLSDAERARRELEAVDREAARADRIVKRIAEKKARAEAKAKAAREKAEAKLKAFRAKQEAAEKRYVDKIFAGLDRLKKPRTKRKLSGKKAAKKAAKKAPRKKTAKKAAKKATRKKAAKKATRKKATKKATRKAPASPLSPKRTAISQAGVGPFDVTRTSTSTFYTPTANDNGRIAQVERDKHPEFKGRNVWTAWWGSQGRYGAWAEYDSRKAAEQWATEWMKGIHNNERKSDTFKHRVF